MLLTLIGRLGKLQIPMIPLIVYASYGKGDVHMHTVVIKNCLNVRSGGEE